MNRSEASSHQGQWLSTSEAELPGQLGSESDSGARLPSRDSLAGSDEKRGCLVADCLPCLICSNEPGTFAVDEPV